LDYNEPPAFFPPVRPALGRVLMDSKQFAEAERVYRAALERSPRLPRALAGLRDSLKAQNRLYEAQQIEQQMNNLAAGGTATSNRAVLKSSGKLAD
jgi:uncharacterized protein HemY